MRQMLVKWAGHMEWEWNGNGMDVHIGAIYSIPQMTMYLTRV
jgi:hypothetical protein